MANRLGSAAAGLLSVIAAARGTVPPPAVSLVDGASSRTDPAVARELTRMLAAQTPGFRTIVTTDVEIDDIASFHRLLLYANDFADSLVGIVTTSSEFHWAGDPTAVPPVRPRAWDRWPDLPPGQRRSAVLGEVVAGGGAHFGAKGGYAGAYPNLCLHDDRYPAPAHLLGLRAAGNVASFGEMATDTEGSELIKQELLADDPRPLWLQAWGGTNTIAAALRSIHDEFGATPGWALVREQVLATARLYLIGDQDRTYKEYLRPHWPGLRVVLNRDQFWALGYRFGRVGAGRRQVPAPLEAYLSRGFMGAIARGPLLASYPLGPVFLERRRGTFVGEADSPAFLHLVPNGLRSADDPSYGGWGGRFAATATPGLWSDCPGYADDPRYTSILNVTGRRAGRDRTRVRDGARGTLYPQARWIPALQNDLVARSAWQHAVYSDANHPPVAYVPPELRNVAVAPGATVELHGQAADPDGDGVAVRWWHYPQAGTYTGPVEITGATTVNARIVVPADAHPGNTIHVILEVTDTGTPLLTRYQRVVMTVS